MRQINEIHADRGDKRSYACIDGRPVDFDAEDHVTPAPSSDGTKKLGCREWPPAQEALEAYREPEPDWTPEVVAKGEELAGYHEALAKLARSRGAPG